jgi:hypothetical protein
VHDYSASIDNFVTCPLLGFEQTHGNLVVAWGQFKDPSGCGMIVTGIRYQRDDEGQQIKRTHCMYSELPGVIARTVRSVFNKSSCQSKLLVSLISHMLYPQCVNIPWYRYVKCRVLYKTDYHIFALLFEGDGIKLQPGHIIT